MAELGTSLKQQRKGDNHAQQLVSLFSITAAGRPEEIARTMFNKFLFTFFFVFSPCFIYLPLNGSWVVTLENRYPA